eukprot:TRINITY_DN34725_c0_g1_i1.p1 TRINITY_DN34725_c0_g1~~TRINITY_DN34725_c0_g1_i1.p1  ORF type:complete len:963 (-),score=177.04 TRINITY_DN34725_c0_g1_i1:502-3390(-)
MISLPEGWAEGSHTIALPDNWAEGILNPAHLQGGTDPAPEQRTGRGLRARRSPSPAAGLEADELGGSFGSRRRPFGSPSRGTPPSPPSPPSRAPAAPGGIAAESKAAELLRRACEGPKEAAPIDVVEIDKALGVAVVPASNVARALPVPGAADAPGGEQALQVLDSAALITAAAEASHERSGYGMFGVANLPNGASPSVNAYTGQASEALRRSVSSFRAGFRGGLVAIPSQGRGGTFRVRLLRLDPSKLVPRHAGAGCSPAPAQRLPFGISLASRGGSAGSDEAVDEEALMDAQVTAGLGKPSPGGSGTVPVPLRLDGGAAQAVLRRYCEMHGPNSGCWAAEVFKLIDALLGEGWAGPSMASSRRREPPGAKSEDLKSVHDVARRLSRWLSCVNARTIEKHSAKSASVANIGQKLKLLAVGGSRIPGTEPERSSTSATVPRLKAAFLHLTANCVRRAMKELNAAATDAQVASPEQHQQVVYFDRLATIVAACGGVSAPSSDRRRWLHRQLAEWRVQGVNNLMDPALWRIYCLLAGDLNEVVSESLDWRTAFGMFLWFRSPDESDEKEQYVNELRKSVKEFEATVRKFGSGCRFRPVPSYMVDQPRRSAATFATDTAIVGLARGLDSGRRNRGSGGVSAFGAGPGGSQRSQGDVHDLQYSIIRTCVGFTDWRALSQFDYRSYSALPLDVACSWHTCALILALRGGGDDADGSVTAGACSLGREGTGGECLEAFQLLTQQYCLTLELCGRWRLAVYVALFVTDERARGELIRGLLRRHAGVLGAKTMRPHEEMRLRWPGVSEAWVRNAEALRFEAEQDWPAAVKCWLRCANVSKPPADGSAHAVACVDEQRRGAQRRAIVLTEAFLQRPLLLGHISAPFQRGAIEDVVVAPMSRAARWVLSALEDLRPGTLRADEPWSVLAKELLGLLRAWSAGTGDRSHNPQDLARILRWCDCARRYTLGLPW